MVLRSVVGKWWFLFVLLMVALYSLLGYIIYQFALVQYMDDAEYALVRSANRIYDLVNQDSNLAWTDDQLLNLADDDVIQFIVYYQDTVILTSPGADQSELITLINDGQNISDASAFFLGKLPFNGEKLLVSAIQDEQLTVVTYQPWASILKRLETIQLWLWIIGTFLITTMSLFIYLLAKRITIPILRLRKSALELANGEFKTKVPMVSHDELGELAMAFNRMGRQLNYHINALKQEKEILHNIIGSMNDGVVTLNLDGEIILSNRQAEHFLADMNYETNPLTVDDFESTMSTPFIKAMQEVMSKRKEKIVELEVQGRIWILIATPLMGKEKVRGVVVIIRDMTEQRRLEQLKDAFVANVSHELRTPISLLQGYSEAIVDGLAETPEHQQELAQIILDESLRMGRLVNDLLDLERLKAGQMALAIQTHLVKPFLERIIRKFNSLAEQKALLLRLDLDPSVEELAFDYDRLEQVFTNLIDNAIRHTPIHGTIMVSCMRDQHLIIFKVKDSGTGIPKEDLPFVFDRFYKADKARTRSNLNKKGTGLGLAIAKQIVEAHNGTIKVQSKQQMGTTFQFTIPT